jgi:hypothetical protein
MAKSVKSTCRPGSSPCKCPSPSSCLCPKIRPPPPPQAPLDRALQAGPPSPPLPSPPPPRLRQRRRRERRCGHALGAPRQSLAACPGRLRSAPRSRPKVLETQCSGKRKRMGVAEHASARFQRSLEHFLRLGELGLVRKGRGQIVRTRQRVGMLLSQYPPHQAKHLPLDPLRVSVLPLARERLRQIARTRQRGWMLLTQYLLAPSTSRWIRSASPYFPWCTSDAARLPALVSVSGRSSPSTRFLAPRTSRSIRSASVCFP